MKDHSLNELIDMAKDFCENHENPWFWDLYLATKSKSFIWSCMAEFAKSLEKTEDIKTDK